MAYASLVARTASLPRPEPALIGRFTVDGEVTDFPVSEEDMQCDTQWCAEVLRAYGLKAGDHVVLSSHAWQCPWVDQIRTGSNAVDAVYSNVEAWPWDAPRMISFLRRFSVSMLAGINGQSFEALRGMCDFADLLGKVPHLLAYPDAAQSLRECGFQPRMLALIGPVLALSSPEDATKLIVNDEEWLVEAVGGELLVTSVGARSGRFDRQKTGVRGTASVVAGRILLELDS